MVGGSGSSIYGRQAGRQAGRHWVGWQAYKWAAWHSSKVAWRGAALVIVAASSSSLFSSHDCVAVWHHAAWNSGSFTGHTVQG